MNIELRTGTLAGDETTSMSFGAESFSVPSLSTPSLSGEFSLPGNSFSGHEFSTGNSDFSGPSIMEGPTNFGHSENIFNLPKIDTPFVTDIEKPVNSDFFSSSVSLLPKLDNKVSSSSALVDDQKPQDLTDIIKDSIPYQTNNFETFDKSFEGVLSEDKWKTVFAQKEDVKTGESQNKPVSLKDFVFVKIGEQRLSDIVKSDYFSENTQSLLREYVAIYPEIKHRDGNIVKSIEPLESKTDLTDIQDTLGNEQIIDISEKSEKLPDKFNLQTEIGVYPQIEKQAIEEVVLDVKQAVEVMEIAEEIQGWQKAKELVVISLHEKFKRNNLEQPLYHYINAVLQDLEEKKKTEEKEFLSGNIILKESCVVPENAGSLQNQISNEIQPEAKEQILTEAEEEVKEELKPINIQMGKVEVAPEEAIEVNSLTQTQSLTRTKEAIAVYPNTTVIIQNKTEEEDEEKRKEEKGEENKEKKKKATIFYERDVETDETRKNLFEKIVFASFSNLRALASVGKSEKLSLSGKEFVEKMPSANEQPKPIKSRIVREELKRDGSYSEIIEKMSSWRDIISEFIALARMKFLIKRYPSVKASVVQPPQDNFVKDEDVKRVESNKSPRGSKISINPFNDILSL